VIEEIQRCHKAKSVAAEPQCLLMIGPTGAGKTTLISSYTQKYPVIEDENGFRYPVLQATLPSPASERNLATALLYALGDPLAGKGTTGLMTLRLIKLLMDCQVELLILDELQHFVDRDSQKVLQNASNWLKTLLKETKVACVLVGLQGEAEQVVNINPQLARLFGDPLILSPFVWDENIPSTILEFRTFLADLEPLLPLAEPTNLQRRDLAQRIFVASEGLISYLMALIRRATQLALQLGKEYLDEELLAEAFAQRLAGKRRGIPNPFLGEVPAIQLQSNPGSLLTDVSIASLPIRRGRGKRREKLADII
jgi:hypothetical protein